jgi:hypothetical protein
MMPTAPDTTAVIISRAELLWITLGTWVGGVFILALLPVLLIPRLGLPMGMGVSYLVFFMAWQPVQSITQRVLGTRVAVLRMVGLVGGGAVIAYYLREGLLALLRGSQGA